MTESTFSGRSIRECILKKIGWIHESFTVAAQTRHMFLGASCSRP